jgi:hypothetical protein
MDGTTRASEYCSFATSTDTNSLSAYRQVPASGDKDDPVKRPTKFENHSEETTVLNKVISLAARMNRRGFFKKPWILMPINVHDNHWVFLGLLNVAYLGTPQDKKFSGFFVYDSMRKDSTRDTNLTMLHNKGILNLIVYINLVYGSPPIQGGNNIRNMVFDPQTFSCITVPNQDFVRQGDSFNCGIFIWLCMVEVSLVHSGRYTKKEDFAEAVSGGDLVYQLRDGEWFNLFKETTFSTEKKSPTSDRVLRPPPPPKIPLVFFDCIRKQAVCLFNRIMTFKAMGVHNYSPRYAGDHPFPKFLKAKWRRLVWQIGDDEQLEIQNYQKWLEGCQGELSKLLKCKNPIIANSDIAHLSDPTEEEKEEEIDKSATIFTTTELKKAGMYVDLFGDGTSPTKPSSGTAGNDEKESPETESADDNERKPPAKDWKSLTLQQSGQKPPAAFVPPRKEPRSQQKKKSKKRRRRRTNDEDSDDDSKSTGSVVPEWEPGEKRVTEDSIKKKYGRRTAQDYPHAQRKLDKAKIYISKHIVNLPNTKSDLGIWTFKERSKRKNRSETLAERAKRIDETNENWSKFEPHKEIEAKLHLWDSIKQLQYVPSENNDVLSGSFNAIMSEDNSIVNLSARWVKNHFADDVVKLVVEKEMGTFVDVQSDVKVHLDLRQIRKLRWNVVPAGQVDSDGNQEESFFDGVTADRMVCKLDQQFVWSNFPKAFVEKVVEAGENLTRKFVFVPSGAPRTREGHEMMDLRYPKVEFLQHGRATCLFSSFASALYYVGIIDIAAIFASNATRFSADSEEGVHNWKAILQIMQQSCKWLQPKKIKGWNYDIVHEKSIFPTVVALEDCQGGTHHAITIVGGIIFDSNCERALPLTRKSLDYCCSTDTKAGKFWKVHKGYRFVEDQNKKNKIYEKIATKRGTNFFMKDTNGDQE